MKRLVVYFTKGGHTRIVAQMIGQVLKADFEILTSPFRKHSLKFKPEQYDIVIIGGPTEGNKMVEPIREYLKFYSEKFHSVAFFLTNKGTDANNVVSDLITLVKRNPVAVVDILESEIDNGTWAEKLPEFIDIIHPK